MIETWNGDGLARLIERALKLGIDKTSSDAVKEAKGLVHVRTATLQGSIAPDPARVVGDQVVGQFSTHDVSYAGAQEFLPPEKGGKAYMRPVAATAMENLGPNIQAAWRSVK